MSTTRAEQHAKVLCPGWNGTEDPEHLTEVKNGLRRLVGPRLVRDPESVFKATVESDSVIARTLLFADGSSLIVTSRRFEDWLLLVSMLLGLEVEGLGNPRGARHVLRAQIAIDRLDLPFPFSTALETSDEMTDIRSHMSVYVLAHEMAHHVLGHSGSTRALTGDEAKDVPVSYRLEAAADDLARDVVLARTATTIGVPDTKQLAIRAVHMTLLVLQRAHYIRRPTVGIGVSDRLSRLEKHGIPQASTPSLLSGLASTRSWRLAWELRSNTFTEMVHAAAPIYPLTAPQWQRQRWILSRTVAWVEPDVLAKMDLVVCGKGRVTIGNRLLDETWESEARTPDAVSSRLAQLGLPSETAHTILDPTRPLTFLAFVRAVSQAPALKDLDETTAKIWSYHQAQYCWGGLTQATSGELP